MVDQSLQHAHDIFPAVFNVLEGHAKRTEVKYAEANATWMAQSALYCNDGCVANPREWFYWMLVKKLEQPAIGPKAMRAFTHQFAVYALQLKPCDTTGSASAIPVQGTCDGGVLYAGPQRYAVVVNHVPFSGTTSCEATGTSATGVPFKHKFWEGELLHVVSCSRGVACV